MTVVLHPATAAAMAAQLAESKAAARARRHAMEALAKYFTGVTYAHYTMPAQKGQAETHEYFETRRALGIVGDVHESQAFEAIVRLFE